MEPMPVTTEPDGASGVIRQACDRARVPDFDGFQLARVADVHTATSSRPGAPNSPAAVKPAESAVSAVKAASGPGELNGTCCQVAPPSAENSANGTVLAAGPAPAPAPGAAAAVAWPRATTRVPLIATCWSTAVAAPSGTGRTIAFHEGPLAVVPPSP